MTTVGELLDRLQRVPRTAEVLAVEPGCEVYSERELDAVDYQGGRVYLHMGVRSDDAPRQ